MNRSSDEGVMAPGSRGVGAVFVHFSDEDSGQTGDAIGEPRVPRRSWSHYLSNAPGLADQLVASRKDSAREGGCPGRKNAFYSQRVFSQILSQFARVFDLVPDVGFRRSWYRRKACVAYFCKVPDLRKSELGLVRYGPANRGHRGVFGPFEGSFPIRIPARPGKILAIREFHVMHECVFFPTCPGSRINLLRVRKTLRASVATSVGKFRNFQQNLISSACFHARGRHSSRCRISTILVSSESLCYLLFNGTGLAQRRAWELLTIRKLHVVAEVNLLPKESWLADQVAAVLAIILSFLVRFRPVKYGIEALDILYTLVTGGQFEPVFGLVNGPVKPWSLGQLGQTWSNLVKALQTLGNVSRTSFQGFLGTVGPSRVGNGSVKPRSNFVFDVDEVFVGSCWLGPGCPVLRADARENPVVRLGLRASPSGVRMGIPRFGEDRSGCEKMVHGSKWTPIDDQFSPIRPRGWFGLGDHPSLKRGNWDESAWAQTEESGTNRPGPPRSRNEICDSGESDLDYPSCKSGRIGFNRFGISVSNRNFDSGPNLTWGLPKLQIGALEIGDKSGSNRFGPPRSRNEICDSGPNRSWSTQPSKRDEWERIGLVHPGLETKFVIRVRIGLGSTQARNRRRTGTNRPGPPRSRNEICDSGPNRSGPPSPRNGTNGNESAWSTQVSNEICDSGSESVWTTQARKSETWERIGLVHPGLETKFVIRVRIGLGSTQPSKRSELHESAWSNRSSKSQFGFGSESFLVHPARNGTFRDKIGLVDSRCLIRGSGSGGHRRSDRLAKGKAAELDAEAAGPASSATRPPPRPGVVIGRSARPSETTRPSPQPSVTTGPGDIPSAAPRRPHTRDYVAPGFRYPPQGGIRPRYPVTVEISDTPLLTNLLAHPSSLVRRCQEPPESVGRGGWSEFSRLLAASRPDTCEMAVLPVDWSAILGIRFGGRAPPSEPVDGLEAREILGLADRDAIEGSRRPAVRIRHLADVLRRDREEPPTELRYRQWAAYFIFSCFLGNDRSTVPTPIVGMFRDIDALREYDWGTLTYGFYIRGLRRYSRRESISFLGFWQFTVFWAFEHFPTFAPSRLPLASDPDFPLARRWDSSRIERMTARTLLELRMTVDCIRDAEIVFQPYSGALTQRPEVFRAVELSHLRLWIRTPRSWELLLGERTLRQLGDEAIVPVDPSPLMTIEDYIPRAPSDPYVVGVSAYPSLVREDVPYQEWFDRVSLGSLMSLHEVEGGRVMGGVAMDSHLLRSSGQIERLEGEETTRVQAELTQAQGEMAQMQTALTQSQRDLGSRDAEVARLTAAVQRLEEQLHSMGITPVTGAGPSGFGQTSSPPPTDPVTSRLVL
uniref:Aminotransferase-like plant mobile domain-containing protein n=1 Tax=Fagus sylvatica TaxID=28930 RepID=A0A2N9GWY5_FAGSY